VRRPNPKRQLLLNLRRGITRVQRRFDVEDLGEGKVRLTCRTCRTVTEEVAGANDKSVKSGARSAPEPGSFEAKFMARYWSGKTQNGISGNCEVCLKAERDRRYPLPPKEGG
jgi:hypothetical protein